MSDNDEIKIFKPFGPPIGKFEIEPVLINRINRAQKMSAKPFIYIIQYRSKNRRIRDIFFFIFLSTWPHKIAYCNLYGRCSQDLVV